MKEKSKQQVTGFRLVAGYFGVFMILIGLLTAVPMLVPSFYPAEWELFPSMPGSSSLT